MASEFLFLSFSKGGLETKRGTWNPVYISCTVCCAGVAFPGYPSKKTVLQVPSCWICRQDVIRGKVRQGLAPEEAT